MCFVKQEIKNVFHEKQMFSAVTVGSESSMADWFTLESLNITKYTFKTKSYIRSKCNICEYWFCAEHFYIKFSWFGPEIRMYFMKSKYMFSTVTVGSESSLADWFTLESLNITKYTFKTKSYIRSKCNICEYWFCAEHFYIKFSWFGPEIRMYFMKSKYMFSTVTVGSELLFG